MENPTRICKLIVGLGEVEILGVNDEATGPLAVHIGTRRRRACGGCGGAVWSKGARPGAVGGPAGVWTPGARGVAQAALALSGWRLRGGVVHRGR